jgi:CheY-like chemotaxis protein
MNAGLILNVEDYAASRYVKTRLLRQAGFRVLEAGNGTRALDMVARFRPDLVLLDVRLPDIDGLEVCRSIRANPATHAIRVVQTSAAFITEQDIVKGMESGADGYLTVPYEPSSLIAILRSLLH